mmetsp:Transcript_39635/g.71379  ORF Transcript_39635/g.71379 Transcript_39635/m.71379 type:complete len:420 (-) Transcript_39635:270-1529(-)
MYAPRYELIDNGIAVMRNRVRVKNIDDADHPDEDSGKYHGSKGRKNARSLSGGKMFLMAVLTSLTAAFCLGTVRRRHKSTRAVPDTDNATLLEPKAKVLDTGITTESERKVGAENLSAPRDLSHCIENPPQPKSKIFVDTKIEPLWLPAYPSSLPIKGYADFVSALTGVPKAAKSYYRSSPGVSRCHNPRSNYNIQAVTCEIVHPIVPCQRPHPSAQAADFGSKVLLSIRNPLTAFPALQQSKAEAYHGQKGQVEKGEWIKFRDQYVGTTNEGILFNEWKNFIMEWRDMKPYNVDIYMPWEYWSDKAKGPALAKRLSLVLKQEGFPILYDDAECLWLKHFYEPIIAEEHKHVEEGWYEPEYTLAQLEVIASELEQFVGEIKVKWGNKDEGNGKRPGDHHLVGILIGYASSAREAIREKM